MSLMEIHRERLSLASSMRDLDGAVSRLDNILMGVVFLICVLILTAMVVSTPDPSFSTRSVFRGGVEGRARRAGRGSF